MSLSVRTRFEVFKRDRFTCSYCGRHAPDVLLEVDHALPLAAGGSDDLANLVTACWDCNRGKSDRLIDESSAPMVSRRIVDDAAERVAQAQEYAKLLKADQDLRYQFEDMVTAAWAEAFGASKIESKEGTQWRFTSGRFPDAASVRRMLRRLPVDSLLEAVDITSGKFRYANQAAERYFFGVCWGMIRNREAGR